MMPNVPFARRRMLPYALFDNARLIQRISMICSKANCRALGIGLELLVSSLGGES